MSEQGSEHKDLSDPSYNFADFKLQLTAGRLRWLCSVLAVAGFGLLWYHLTQQTELEVYYPFHLKGKSAMWMLAIGSAIMFLLAIANWRSWRRKKR